MAVASGFFNRAMTKSDEKRRHETERGNVRKCKGLQFCFALFTGYSSHYLGFITLRSGVQLSPALHKAPFRGFFALAPCTWFTFYIVMLRIGGILGSLPTWLLVFCFITTSLKKDIHTDTDLGKLFMWSSSTIKKTLWKEKKCWRVGKEENGSELISTNRQDSYPPEADGSSTLPRAT